MWCDQSRDHVSCMMKSLFLVLLQILCSWLSFTNCRELIFSSSPFCTIQTSSTTSSMVDSVHDGSCIVFVPLLPSVLRIQTVRPSTLSFSRDLLEATKVTSRSRSREMQHSFDVIRFTGRRSTKRLAKRRIATWRTKSSADHFYLYPFVLMGPFCTVI